jgi:hypothetical protein
MPRRTVLAIASFFLSFFLPAFAITSWAQTSEGNGDSNKPWTSRSESQDSASVSRTRKTETHSQDGNRTVDRQSVEVLRSGSYEPYQDTETETVRVNDTTTRTTVRTYGRDSEGQRTLVQTTEEEKHTLPDGGSRVVRSTSNPDSNGRSQVVQREEQVTKKTAPNVEQTSTTVYLPGVNGGMAPAMKVEERQEHTGEHTVQIEKSTLLPDGAGNWQTGEVKQSTVTDDGKVRSRDEHISRVGPDGRLAEVSRTVGRDVQDGAGEGHSTVETFSTDVPGTSADGTLHMVQKLSTVTSNGLSGSHTTQQQVEQVNPGDPNGGLQVTIQSTDVQTPGAGGTQETHTLQTRGSNGSLGVVSVDMTKSDKNPAVKVEISPAPKAK